jgi:putative membrane protein
MLGSLKGGPAGLRGVSPVREGTFVDVSFAYLHHLAILMVAACLAAEYALLWQVGKREAIERLGRLDTFYFLALGMVVLSGFARFVTSSKGLVFYAGNSLFWLKLLVFIVIAGLSLMPTRHYSRWRHHVNMDGAFIVPANELKVVRLFLMAEMSLVAVLPLLAVLMARNIGHAG